MTYDIITKNNGKIRTSTKPDIIYHSKGNDESFPKM